MRIDLDELERLAKAATPGPWIACGPSFGEAAPKYLNEVVVDNPEDDENDGIEVCRAPVCLEDAVSADMEFIGAANPATVLELLRRLKEAEKDLHVTETQCLDGIQAQHELHEEIFQLRTDAERYRLLKRGQHWSTVNGVGDTLHGEDLDQAIDAVLATQEAKSGD